MLDFMQIKQEIKKNKVTVSPSYVLYNKYEPVKDIMVKGHDFYGMWDERNNTWTTSETKAYILMDYDLDNYVKSKSIDDAYIAKLENCDSGSVDKFKRFVQKQLGDNYVPLDSKLTFRNSDRCREDYCSKRLPYDLPDFATPDMYPNWDKIVGTLYSEEERHKIEWSIGCVVSGDSTWVQKFVVFYGPPGSGKSTIINIIEDMFSGYVAHFDSAALVNMNSNFSLEPFKNNPLVAIEHDGDLSRVNGNCRLNSVVSHEKMTIDEKFKSRYVNSMIAMLFIGTNKAVKITDQSSGLLRRLIDVEPSGRKLPWNTYNKVMRDVKFEYGAICRHCLDVYLDDKEIYNDYKPLGMEEATNELYNFMLEYYDIFKRENCMYLQRAWDMYKNYTDEARVENSVSKRVFKSEFRKYWSDYSREHEGRKDYFYGFITKLFRNEINININNKIKNKNKSNNNLNTWLNFEEVDEKENKFNIECAKCIAQPATSNGIPKKKWANVTTTLSDIPTSILHYVKVPLTHIVIDFDIPNENGDKDLELNIREASKWPKTYAELSKSGSGVHLHYIWDGGDPLDLCSLYDDKIEIKVFSGDQALRRLLTKCVNIPIAHLSSGLPLKKERKMAIDEKVIEDEKHLRALINKAMRKEVFDSTKPNVDFILKITNDMYESKKHYDITDMHDDIIDFALASTHQSQLCLKLVSKIHWKSDDVGAFVENKDAPLVHFDIEVFPNLLLICYMFDDDPKEHVYDLINPTPDQIEQLLKYNLNGFNNRKYDNHIVVGSYLGDTVYDSYLRSKNMIENQQGYIGEAYNASYCDTYDFMSDKKSLKKLEIEMGEVHDELGLPWDKEVPRELWPRVIEYCHHDVKATKAGFHYKAADFTARKILADLAGGTVNDTTNSLTTKFIFGDDKNPQSQFYYRDLSKPVFEKDLDPESIEFLKEVFPDMMKEPHGEAKSLLPYFPGYKFEMTDKGYKSTYLGEDVGEGGFAQGFPGYYENVALLDVMSMHPHSLMAEVLFGPVFTKAFHEIVYGRVHIKHKAWDIVDTYLGGKLKPYIEKCKAGEMSAKDLANALKIAINSVYGLTAAKFDNPFRDKRNIDNIVAKRGALFMIELKHQFMKKGWPIAHFKTDSIKIPNATMEQISFVMEFGKRYGYFFEHEATYEKMVLVNDAVYIAKYSSKEACESMYGYCPGDNFEHGGDWTATGKEFMIPFVFKKLFSKENIEPKDLRETFSVSKGELYLDFDESIDVEKRTELENTLKKFESKYKKDPTIDLENEIKSLKDQIADMHNLTYIGRVSSFLPMKKGCGAGVLYRVADGKLNAAAGTTGYRWMETGQVEGTELEKDIDLSYWIDKADTAKDSINEYIPYDEFISKIVEPIKDGECRRDCKHCPHLEKWDEEGFCSCTISCDHIEEYAKEMNFELLPF